MKKRSSVMSLRALAPAELLFLLGLLIPGSAALSQPFPSFMLDSTIARGPTLNRVEFTSAASGPDVGLVVWVENGHVRGARVDTSGVLLDSVSIDIGGANAEGFVQMRPGVAWGAHRFLVVWTEAHVDSVLGDSARCAIVDEDGNVVERRVLQGDFTSGQSISAAAAFDGVNFLATWLGWSSYFPLPGAFFTRISPQGVVLDSPPLRVAPDALVEQNNTALCFHDDRYLAVWTVWDSSGVWGNFILPDGSTPDSAGFPIRRGIWTESPSVTHDRQNYVVAWLEWYQDSMACHRSCRLARVSDSGKVTDSTGVLLDSFSIFENSVLSVGDTTLVAYVSDSIGSHDSLTLLAVRVDTGLRRLDTSPTLVSRTEYGNTGGYGPRSPSIAMCGNDYVVAWHNPRWTDRNVSNPIALYRRVDREGQLVDSAPVLASFGANQQRRPRVASSGTDFLATWWDSRRSSSKVVEALYAERFAADGTVLDSEALMITATNWAKATAAFGGDCYLVAWWSPDKHAWAARISSDGVLMDTLPFLLSGSDELATADASVCYGDSVFLVVWQTSEYQVHGVRVSPSGQVLDSIPLLLQKNSGGYSVYPQAAFDGHNFLVVRNVRSYYQSTLDATPDVPSGRAGPERVNAMPIQQACRLAWNGFSAVRVNTEGQIIDPNDITFAPDYGATTTPGLAFGDGVYVVTHNARYVSWLLSTEGVVLDSVSHSNSGRAQVCFDGTNFLLLCQEYSAVTGMRLSPEGILLDSVPFPLVNAGYYDPDAHIAASAAGHVGLVFCGFEPNPLLARRIRAVTFPAIVGISSERDATPAAAFRVLPNPASRLALLSFNLTQAGPVCVTAFDAAGRKCASLFSGRMNAGMQTVPLDTRRLANGVYFLRLEAGVATNSTRLVVSH